MSTEEQHPIHQAFADAVDAGGPAVIDLGRSVLCDSDSTDLTDDPRSGGFMFGSYAIGPCCAERRLASIRGYGEESHITAWCPPGLSFADWVRQIREVTGNNAITITPGWPGMIIFILACVLFIAVLAAAVALTLRAIGTFGTEEEAPSRRRRERGSHERDKSPRGFDWRGEGLKARLYARNQARIEAEAARKPEPAPLLAAPLTSAPQPGTCTDHGQACVIEDRGQPLTEAYICTQCGENYDPHYGCACTRALDVRTNEDTADDWVGDLGPAERAAAEPERPLRRQQGRLLDGAVLYRVTPVVLGALIAAAKARVTVYPEWTTGQFVIADMNLERSA